MTSALAGFGVPMKIDGMFDRVSGPSDVPAMPRGDLSVPLPDEGGGLSSIDTRIAASKPPETCSQRNVRFWPTADMR